jgi:uncharacterized protein YcfL
MKPFAPLFFAWLAATGCASSVNTSNSFKTSQPSPPPAPPPLQQPARPAAPPAPAPATDKRVVIDPSLAQALHAVKVQSSLGAEGYLKVQVDVENRSEAPLRFSYSMEWLDGNGAVLPLAGNGFLDWMLRAHETSSIGVTAPTPTAKDFRITFLGRGR